MRQMWGSISSTRRGPICDEAADGEILLSPRAYAAVEDQFAAESTGEISLKGIHAAVEVFRVTSNRATSEHRDLDNL